MHIGSVKGTIQIFDIQTGHMVRDESVLSCQVRGIEWASLHSLVAHGCENLNGNTGKSEIAFVNIKTGSITLPYISSVYFIPLLCLL